jgi:pimeloyl-ACP methyl ester carboxylesterase
MRFELLAPHVPPEVHWRSVTLPGFQGVPDRSDLTSMHAYGAVLAELVEKAATTQPVVLLGHGIGGSIALEMVQRHASLIDGLILHAPVGANLDTRLFPRVMKRPIVRRLAKTIISSPLPRPLLRRAFFDAKVDRAYLDRFFNEYKRCNAFSRMFDIITQPWFDGLSPVTIPTVLLWGSGDRVLDASQRTAFDRVLPNSRTVSIEGWDHFPMIEQPEEYAINVVRLARELTAQR